MQHCRQHRAKQELRIVQRGVGQDILFGHEARTDRCTVPCGLSRRRDRRARRRYRVAQALARIVARREELGIGEHDGPRRSAAEQILGEFGRQIDRRDGTAGADCARRRAEIVATLGDRDPGSSGDRLDEQARRRAVVHIDGDNIQPAHHGGTEGEPERHKGDDRHAEQQEARHGVAQDPANLPRRDSRQPAPQRHHERRSAQSV